MAATTCRATILQSLCPVSYTHLDVYKRQGVDTIFSKEECLYWIPDYWKSDNFQIYNEKGELLEYYNATKDSKAKVTYDVYDEQEVLRASMTVELSKKEQQGVMKILELHTYPSFSPE